MAALDNSTRIYQTTGATMAGIGMFPVSGSTSVTTGLAGVGLAIRPRWKETDTWAVSVGSLYHLLGF